MKKNIVISVLGAVVLVLCTVLVVNYFSKKLGATYTINSGLINTQSINVITTTTYTNSTSTRPTYMYPYSEQGYKYGSLQVTEIANSSFIIQGSNSGSAWTNITAEIVGTTSTAKDPISVAGIYFLRPDYLVNQIRLLFTTSSAISTSTVNVIFGN